LIAGFLGAKLSLRALESFRGLTTAPTHRFFALKAGKVGQRLHEVFAMALNVSSCFSKRIYLLVTRAMTIVVCALVFQSHAQAQSQIMILDSDELSDLANTETTLSVREEGYFAREDYLYGHRQYTLVDARIKMGSNKPHLRSGFNGGFTVAASSPGYYTFDVPEAYVTFLQSSMVLVPAEITLGRKLMPWSKLDSDWSLGIWQPMQRFDMLRPAQQGLMGLFLTWGGPSASFTLYGSYIYIPEQAAGFKIKNARFVSESPWFSEPASEAVLQGVRTEVHYTLTIPPYDEIILRPLVGGMFTVGQMDDGGWFKVAYSYKPRNQVPTPFKHRLDPLPGELDIDLYAHVENHHVSSFEVGYTAKKENKDYTEFSISTLFEVPENSELDSEYNRPKYALQTLVSPTIEARRSGGWFPETTYKLSYLHQTGGEVKGEGPLFEDGSVSSAQELFGYRIDFSRAIMAALGVEFLGDKTKRLETKLKWIEDFNQRADLVMLELDYNPTQALKLMLSADFLGSSAPLDEKSGLITRFRGNDRVGGGIAYAF
jgi:hypothetical protein